MSKVDRRYQCYVCKKSYPPEQLGRLRLPLMTRAGRSPWWRIVCSACFTAIVDSWSVDFWLDPPVLHGF